MEKTSASRFFQGVVLCVVWVLFGQTASAITVGPVTVAPPGDPTQVPQYGKIELNVALSSASTAFYEADPAQGGVDLSAVFTAPDASTWGSKGFYNGSAWVIRFAPAQTGLWQVNVTATDSSGSASADPVNFTCVASNCPGFARINGRYLQFSNGAACYAVGHNNGWQYDVEQPALSDMAALGENLLSFWFAAPWTKPTDSAPYSQRTPIENSVGGLGNYDQNACAYIDLVVSDAEAAGVCLLPSIWAHDQLCDGSAPSGWPASWSNNAYSAICSATNFYQTTSGGADTAQWRLQKNFYRYVLARWGYSQAIVGWVGVVEIDGTTGYVQNATQATAWCGAVRSYFAGNDKFRANASGQYPLIFSKVDAPSWDGGANIRGTDSYSSKTNNVNVASALASETSTMRASGKPATFTEFGGDTLNGATQPAHLHNGIWAGAAAGTAMTPLLWCDGGNYPMLTNASTGAAMRSQLQNLSQFVSNLSFTGNNSLVATIPTISGTNCKAWAMQLSDRGFAWIQNTAGGTMGGQTLTVKSLAAGKYTVAWYDVWTAGGAPFTTSGAVTVGSNSNLAVAVPPLAQSDIACFFLLYDHAPTVSITSPAAGTVFAPGSTITITASATADGSVTQVAFYSNGVLLGTVTTSPYTFTWTNVPAGSYSLTAVVTDDAGLTTTSAAVNIKVDAPPTVSITSPANNSSFRSGTRVTVTASASDSDGTVSSVTFYDNGAALGTVTRAPYSYTYTPSKGTHNLTAKATDNAGLSTTSAVVTITVK